ncbi:Glucosamine kinase GspK [Pseudoruegeria aquimaris]|uniref:Glucosamine kinase GspK n=1 Tax=Pseudoruegeria aquimaris TaxID=393663 RepID=A0A1Y5RJM8_9RHOB|nr:BadF/BadG/BcrA/BcrD ATPase family protein [Pseudoruegeria aquimaris]SLN16315.1 Glucosamine kinase GspK [Pseudoruegeria aquimaris]
MKHDSHIIAVDGGGTRCRFLIEGHGARHAVELGSANVTTGFDAAMDVLREGLAALGAAAGLSGADLRRVPAFVGLAGVKGAGMAQRVAAALPLAYVRVDEDRPAAIRGALGARIGAVAHCGTGSFLGRQAPDGLRVLGGWGAVLGDEASAYWVGRQLLAAAVNAEDGVVERSAVISGLSDQFSGPQDIVSFAFEAPPREVAALARRVTAAAEGGDPVARAIMAEGAAYLMRSLAHLGWKAGEPLCFTGGIGPHYTAYLPEAARACVVAPAGSTMDGALALARDFSKELAP